MQADTWKAVAHIPWMVKPLYGFFTDTFPILGMRRRPYIAICGIAGAFAVLLLLTWLWPQVGTQLTFSFHGYAGMMAFSMLSLGPPRPLLALLFMTLAELAIAFSDVCIDGVVVEKSKGEDQAMAGSLQSLCWGSQVWLLRGTQHICSLYFPVSLKAPIRHSVHLYIRFTGIDFAYGCQVLNNSRNALDMLALTLRCCLCTGHRGAVQRLPQRLAHRQGGRPASVGHHGAVSSSDVWRVLAHQ